MNGSQISEKERRLLERFLIFEDPHERLEAIIAFGKRWPGLPPNRCTEETRITECSSRAWVEGFFEKGEFQCFAEAELPLVRGLAALVCALYQGASPARLPLNSASMLEALGLWNDLSPARQYGVLGTERRLRQSLMPSQPPTSE